MQYATARARIKTGDALLFSTTGWRTIWDKMAQVVRIKRRSRWSHVGMAVVAHGRVWCLEATRHGVWPIPLSNKGEPFGWIPYHHLNQEELDRAYSIVGQRYGWIDAFKADAGKLIVGNNQYWECAEAFMWWHRLTEKDCAPIPDEVESFLLRGFRPLYMVDQP